MSEIGWDGTQSAWLVRGGEHGQREVRALAEGLVIAGWAELGDIGAYGTREGIREALEATARTGRVLGSLLRLGIGRDDGS